MIDNTITMNTGKEYPASVNYAPKEDLYIKSKKNPESDPDKIKEVDDKLVGDDREIADATNTGEKESDAGNGENNYDNIQKS